MSRVLVEPNQCSSHTSSMIRSRVTTRAGLAEQQGEEVELLRRQLELVLADPGPPGGLVDPHAVDLRRPGVAAPPQHRPHAGQQLGEPERLGDVVVGAGVEPEHGVDLVGPPGEHEDRHRAAGGAQAPAHVEAVDVGQPEVEQRRGRRRRARPRSSASDAAGGDRRPPGRRPPCAVARARAMSGSSSTSSTRLMTGRNGTAWPLPNLYLNGH